MSDKVYDHIIIGSGFGGSVSAMRLAERGYDVLVLEMGKEYKAKDFPKNNWKLAKFFWSPMMRWFGFQRLTFFKNVFILSGVGVGGGSLVYANTHMFPPDEFFSNPSWIKSKDWKKTLIPFYEKAKFMLGTVKNKTFGEEDAILKGIAEEMGRPESFEGVDVGVYFGDTEKETDPYFKGLGPMRKGCTECAGCMVGCKETAKNSLDYNYLYFAQKFGAKIKAETKATKIEYDGELYTIHTVSSTAFLSKKRQVFKTKNIVFAAGVLGTMDILLKQKHKYKTLTNLSETLGENLRTNSETLCGVTSKNKKLNNGIAISSIFNPDDDTHIEIVKYPSGSNSMKMFSTLATKQSTPFLRPFVWFGNIFYKPRTFFKQLIGRKFAEKSVVFLVMQSLDNSMKMVYKRFPFSRISIENKKENRVPAYIDIGQKVMHRYAEKVDGLPQNATTEVLFNMSSTAHILGGIPMGETDETGVINDKFEVFNYPGMMILDGSIIPGNLGVNPSLTITAISEYAMSLVPIKEGSTTVSLEEQMAHL